MRRQFYKTLEFIVEKDPRVIVLLGDIGVFGCRNIFSKHPKQIINVGVCEQSMISMAAGLAKEGFIPIVHTIAPFMVERGLEQLKLDVGYQQLPVKVVSIGASYDYASLGATHHCPADVAIMKTIPNMRIIVPGSADEFDSLFTETYNKNDPVYYRLSDFNHSENVSVAYGKANAITIKKDGGKAVIAIGNLLSNVVEATSNMKVDVLYYTTLHPFDSNAISPLLHAYRKIVIVEPFYEGTMVNDVVTCFHKTPVAIKSIGVSRIVQTYYGKKEEHDDMHGLTSQRLKVQIEDFLC